MARQFARPEGRAGDWLVGPMLDAIGRPMMAAALAALRPMPGETVADVGIGGGWLVERLLAAGASVMAVDPSLPVLRRAARRHAAAVADGRLRLLEGAAESLPLPSAALDAAASVNSLYFWSDLDGPLADFARVLRPGGRLVLGFQTADSVRAWPGHVHGFQVHEEAAIQAAVAGAGFRLQAITPGRHRRVGDYRTLVALRG